MLTKERNDASAAGRRETGAVPVIDTQAGEGVLRVALAGPWTTHTVGHVDAEMRRLAARQGVAGLQIDLSDVSRLDTAGAWVIKRLAAAQEQSGARVEIGGEGETDGVLLAAVDDAIRQQVPHDADSGRWGIVPALEAIGRLVYAFRDEFLLGMHILGATISGAQMKRGRGHGVNPAAIVHQIDRMGVGAIPVILLMSAIVGAIVAQQGAFQLRYFGAEIFVVDLVGILVLREMGVLLTAIMIAGRSGSAITAEIGSMKMREEIDALTVIGLNPVGVLVFPRLVALLIALPCLTIAADFAAVGGAMAVSWYYSGIAPSAFIDRMRDAIDLSTIFAGLIKAPFMALIIGVIASVEGIKVGGSAESLGSHVTAAVVKAIFVVIVVDGIFAIFYAAIGF
ncbi:MlaE family lipid ABC transporter permease subunit [Nitratireductor sp. CAU 1489]|uniref:MlaE family lipid ABC transporter permease subunit n=1 Tax=Nitratireductor arenosus TaxID=2682096 RepID=A0A844QF02_9HYPH|nr:ABC transporter permease [Nitratireductor arenosus]MVA97627.1 MlaE family lipid ABC transporter permease subunit [Nitratireductor arenosus]